MAVAVAAVATVVKAVVVTAVVVAAAADVDVKKAAAPAPAPTIRRAPQNASAIILAEDMLLDVSFSETERSGLFIISYVVVKLHMKGKIV